MAKTVQPIAIELGIKGGEKLAALNRSFRDLSKQVKLSDADITQATKDIVDFAAKVGDSEATIKGQIKAFEGLREQAAMGGKAYTALKQEISELKSTLRGSSAAVEAKRKSLVELGSSANATATQIQSAIKALTVLRSETRLDSEAFNAFGQSIDRLAERFEKLNQEAQDFANAQARSGRAISASSGAAKQQIKDLDLVTQALREQKEELGRLEGEARIRRGVADLAERGAVSSSRRSYQEALAESVLSGTSLRELLSKKDIKAALAEVELQIAEFQQQIESKLSRGLQISFQETSRAARESARAMAAAFADPELLGILDHLDQRIGELPNTTAGFNQRLRELQQRFVNTIRDGGNYVSVALEIARVQREAAAATEGLGAALVRDLNTGVAARSSKNLREAIGQLQSEMNELDVQTAEGSRRYAEKANQVRNLETQLRQLGDSYRHVSDMAQQAAAAQGVYANTATARNYLNRAMVRAQEAAGAQVAEAVRAGVAATPLMLPAAGGTTAPGTGAAMSGGAVPRRGTVGPLQPIAALPTNLGTVGGRRQRPAGIEAEIDDQARRSYISQTDAIRKNTEAKEAARRADLDLRREIRSAKSAYDGSINSINRLRGAIESYRVTLPATSKRFQLLTRDLVELDRKSELISRRMGRRRMSPMQMTQAAGAAISGGIFGGPEGFLGGVGGALIGGVGGAFAGAAAGAQVGMIRQQIGQYTEMAAEINRLRLGLAGASNNFKEFVQATQATEQASQRLLIPLADSYRIMTQLRANTVELGISVDDTRKIFEGIAASVYKTGGGLAEVEGAMRAVVQVLSKGAPQAEEIRGQLGERLPAAIIDFARFTKRTPEELADAFQNSKVTLEEFVDFAKNKFKENEGYLDNLATNAEYAGRRYEKSLERLQLTLGRTFQTTGAALQDFASNFLSAIDSLILSLNELGLVSKGPQALMQEFLSSGKGIEELDAELRTLEAQVAKMRENKIGSFATDIFEPLFAFTVPAGTRKALEERIKNLKELREIFDQLDQQTKQRKKEDEESKKKLETEKAAQSLLNAIEQRENAIAQARIQLEEQAANIRKQAIEQARQLEERFADQRLQKERELQDLRRQLAYVEEDIAFGAEEARAVAAGADPEVFNTRRQIIEISRQQKEEEIALDRQLLDEQAETSEAIEEFKSSNAKAIMEANEQHTKRMGEIQREYATNVAKIIEEGTGRAGKRLEISGKIVAELIRKGNAETTLNQLGVVPSKDGGADLLPGYSLDEQSYGAVRTQIALYDDAVKKIKKYTEELNALPTSTAIVAPAIDSIGVNISDLTAKLNANKSALEATRQQIRGLSKDLSDSELIEEINAIFGEQAAPVSNALMVAQTQLAEQRGVLRLRQEGYSESTARQLFAQETRAASALRNLEVAREEANRRGIRVDEAEYAKVAEDIRRATEEARALTLALENLSTGDKLRTGIVQLRDELRTLVDPANQITGAASAIGDAFSQSFINAITGATTAKQALADFFKSVASYFLDMAKRIIAKMITIAILNAFTGLLPGGSGGSGGNLNLAEVSNYSGVGADTRVPTPDFRANGGPVSANQPYIVGERGPELFVPSRSGSIVPNDRLGGGDNVSVVVNVDAKGTSVQGNDQGGNQLGLVLSAAVQAELIKQKRPGGLLA